MLWKVYKGDTPKFPALNLPLMAWEEGVSNNGLLDRTGQWKHGYNVCVYSNNPVLHSAHPSLNTTCCILYTHTLYTTRYTVYTYTMYTLRVHTKNLNIKQCKSTHRITYCMCTKLKRSWIIQSRYLLKNNTCCTHYIRTTIMFLII